MLKARLVGVSNRAGRKVSVLFTGALLALACPSLGHAVAQAIEYINLKVAEPDGSRSNRLLIVMAEKRVKLAIDGELIEYAEAFDCSDAAVICIQSDLLDFRIPRSQVRAAQPASWVEGKVEYFSSGLVRSQLLGREIEYQRVTRYVRSRPVASYLFSPELGLIAIGEGDVDEGVALYWLTNGCGFGGECQAGEANAASAVPEVWVGKRLTATAGGEGLVLFGELPAHLAGSLGERTGAVSSAWTIRVTSVVDSQGGRTSFLAYYAAPEARDGVCIAKGEILELSPTDGDGHPAIRTTQASALASIDGVTNECGGVSKNSYFEFDPSLKSAMIRPVLAAVAHEQTCQAKASSHREGCQELADPIGTGALAAIARIALLPLAIVTGEDPGTVEASYSAPGDTGLDRLTFVLNATEAKLRVVAIRAGQY